MSSPRWLDRLLGLALTRFTRLFTGAYANWQGCKPEPRQRLYFANHSSHLDFPVLWAMLPTRLREQTRPVAGTDYWNASALRRYLIQRVFRGVLIDRSRASTAHHDVLAPLYEAIAAGDSLIFFPEGTRSLDDGMLPFKPGLHHIARRHPDLELVPVRIENLNRMMPKGECLPVPLVCVLSFGTPIVLGEHESRQDFLGRARQAILDMKPGARA